MGRARALYEAGTVTLSGTSPNATGMVIIQPGRFGVLWNVTRIVITSNTPNTIQQTLTLYRGFVSPGNQLGSTYSGQNDTDDCDFQFTQGDIIIGVFTGGNAGDTGTVTLTGTFEDMRRGF